MNPTQTNRLDVLVPKNSPRLKYILNWVLGERLGLDHRILADGAGPEPGIPAIGYGQQPVDGVPFLAASRLLFETGMNHAEPTWSKIPEPVLFSVSHRASEMPFDPFAAAFYMLSRYEEYQPFRPDAHGRFTMAESILRHDDNFKRPVVDTWVSMLAGWLSDRFPGLSITRTPYAFRPSYDIDVAYAYRHRGPLRVLGAMARDLARLDVPNLVRRLRVMAGRQADPFDTYDWQFALHERLGLEPVYFILFATYAERDKNLPIHSEGFRSLIKHIRDHARVGNHPSYRSYTSFSVFSREFNELGQVLNEPVTCSRQHYIRLGIPGTYRWLARLGVTDDYSMGFPTSGGFRAGTASPFLFYDLEYEVELPLRVHPFCIMDGTLRDYLGLDPDAALAYVRELNQQVRTHGGVFMTLWHNESLSDVGRWSGWREFYEDVAELAATAS